MEDNEIMDLYWKRDESAIQETDHKYHGYCFSIADHIIGSHEDAEECVNDTWLNTWNAIPPERPSMFQTWLGKVCRNLSINVYEKMHAQKRGSGETEAAADELAEVLSNGMDSEKELDAVYLKDSINAFLSQEYKQARIFFVQRYWYMLSVKEIAEENHTGESRVKMRLSRTRSRLKDYLREEGYAV